MNSEKLTYLINNPNSLTTKDVEKIETLTKEFPYFQAAKAIHLKNLYDSKSYKYNDMLKKTAAYTIDRNVLFEFITSTPFLEIKTNSKLNSEEKKAVDLSNLITKENEIENQDEAPVILELGKPITFKSSEPHTFNEWMKLSSQKPIKREEKSNDKLNIINQFIKANPKIKPVSKKQTTVDISTESTIENNNLMTETLAKVYLEQKKYTKAIQAYHILSLKYPEKSSFFANRIKAIKILQINKS